VRTIWPLPKIEYRPLREIEERREVALIHTRSAWDAVRGRISFAPRSEGEARDATQAHWAELAAAAQGEVVYAVGGGLAVDAAKYVAVTKGLPLVCIPTALSVDAFLTWASGYRHEGCVRYLETKPPDLLVIDWEVLGAAPAPIRAAGICDVLSIATGCADWEFAEARGKNPANMPMVSYAAQTARGILQGALDCAEAAGRGDEAGLRQLLECLALEVQLCNFLGHSRPEEGSEHYFAYAIENRVGKGLPHGDLVGPGILLMGQVQGLATGPLRKALVASGARLERLPEAEIRATWAELPGYCVKHGLAYGVAHELGGAGIEGALAALRG